MNTKAERSRKKWTREERKYLSDNWGIIKVENIANTLGRSKRAVENQDLWHTKNLTINIFSYEKCYLEKVEADKFKTNKYNKAWSEYEHNIMLDRLSRGFTYEDIAKELNRTTEGVFGRHKYKYRLKL